MAFVQALLRLRNSGYTNLGLWFGVIEAAETFPGSVNAETKRFKTLVNSIRHSHERVTAVPGGDVVEWHDPVVTWEERKAMWHVAVEHERWLFLGNGISIGDLVIQYQLPAAAIQTRMSQGNPPILTAIN